MAMVDLSIWHTWKHSKFSGTAKYEQKQTKCPSLLLTVGTSMAFHIAFIISVLYCYMTQPQMLEKSQSLQWNHSKTRGLRAATYNCPFCFLACRWKGWETQRVIVTVIIANLSGCHSPWSFIWNIHNSESPLPPPIYTHVWNKGKQPLFVGVFSLVLNCGFSFQLMSFYPSLKINT